MPKGVYTRCQINAWDIAKWCNRKATATSWLHEPYYTERKYFPLCESHNNWLERPEGLEVDYDEWLAKYAKV
jgi:hypothetical protein